MKKRSAFDQVPATLRRAESRAHQRDLALCQAERQQVVVRSRKIGHGLLGLSMVSLGFGLVFNVNGWWLALCALLAVLSGVFYVVSYWHDKYFEAPAALNDPSAYHEQRQSLLRGDAAQSRPLLILADEQRARARSLWGALTGKGV